MPENLIQFAMCGSPGKYSPYMAVEPLSRQRVLLLINFTPSTIEEISKKLGLSKGEIKENLKALKKCGLIKESNGQYSPTFTILTLQDQSTLKPLLNELAVGISKIIERRMNDLRELINDLSCSKRGLKFPDLEYILIGAMTLDYGGLRVLGEEELLFSRKKMPGGGNFIFSGLESGLINLREGWMWGHNAVYGKYWFSTHGKLPPKGFRMAFPDVTWQWARHVEEKTIKIGMEELGEILAILSLEDLSMVELKTRIRKQVPEDKLLMDLTLLLALGYVVLKDEKWGINRPFFTADDLGKIRTLSDSILKEIAQLFKIEQPKILKAYAQTAPSKNKIPIEEAFNLLYHLIFEQAISILTRNKVITSPPVRQDNACYSPFIGVKTENL